MKMKKGSKRLCCLLFAVCMSVCTLLIPGVQAEASTVSKKIHIQQSYKDDIYVIFGKGDYKLANVKSDNKNLHLRITYVKASSKENIYSNETPWGYAKIGLYAKKGGKYTVTFDVIGRDKKVKKHHKVSVLADEKYAIKQASFDGKYFYGIETKKKGKIQFKLNKGYKLVSIRMTTYDKSGKAVVKRVKNGSIVTLGQYRKKVFETHTNIEEWRADLLAQTVFEVSYKDNFTKETETTTYTIYRFPSN